MHFYPRADHFENIQSTNWQTMRFKPPPPSAPIGWRVEFRPCELQFTDFENAAVVCFIVLVTRYENFQLISILNMCEASALFYIPQSHPQF